MKKILFHSLDWIENAQFSFIPNKEVLKGMYSLLQALKHLRIPVSLIE